MEPVVPLGGVVITRSYPSYEKGEIISFSLSSKKGDIITHRVVEKGLDAGKIIYLTKGDANEEADSWKVDESQVVGKSALILPYLGYGVNFIKTPKGFVALIIIPASIIVYEELKTIFSEIIGWIKSLLGKKGSAKTRNFPKAVAFFPVAAIALLFVRTSGSFYSDLETSLGNLFQASSSFEEDNLRIYFNDYQATLPPNHTFHVMVDAGDRQIGFMRVEIHFDKTKVQLANEVQIDPGFMTIITPTPLSSANSTGIILFVLGTPGGGTMRTGTFQIASFGMTGQPTLSQQTTLLEFDSPDIQVVDSSATNVPFNVESAVLTINPSTSP